MSESLFPCCMHWDGLYSWKPDSRPPPQTHTRAVSGIKSWTKYSEEPRASLLWQLMKSRASNWSKVTRDSRWVWRRVSLKAGEILCWNVVPVGMSPPHPPPLFPPTDTSSASWFPKETLGIQLRPIPQRDHLGAGPPHMPRWLSTDLEGWVPLFRPVTHLFLIVEFGRAAPLSFSLAFYCSFW